MKVLLVADKENDFIWDHFDPERFKGVELMISCGDLQPSYLSFLVTMISKPLFYVHGNHDTIYLHHPPEGCDSIEDTIVEYKGIRFLGLGGSMKYSGGRISIPEEMDKRIRKLKGSSISTRVRCSCDPRSAFGIGDGKICATGVYEL